VSLLENISVKFKEFINMSSFRSKTANSTTGAPQAASIHNQENRVPNIVNSKQEMQALQEGGS
jgi:hypothetical protein